MTDTALADRLLDALPQTQCTRCGYPDCRSYADAIAREGVPINRCPPGGAEGIVRLARLSGQAVLPLDPAHGRESARSLAIIDEAWCIGCTLCLKACPVDCIVGAAKQMHTVIEDLCTGCELCIPVCPVDCIEFVPITGEHTGWRAWTPAQADQARLRHERRQARMARQRTEQQDRLIEKAEQKLADLAAASRIEEPAARERKRAMVEAALARARARRDETGGP